MKKIIPLAFSVQPLKDALAEYDRTAFDRNVIWDTITNAEDVKKAEAIDAAAIKKVREAFHEVTKDRNSYDHAMLVGIDYCRQVVRDHDKDAV